MIFSDEKGLTESFRKESFTNYAVHVWRGLPEINFLNLEKEGKWFHGGKFKEFLQDIPIDSNGHNSFIKQVINSRER